MSGCRDGGASHPLGAQPFECGPDLLERLDGSVLERFRERVFLSGGDRPYRAEPRRIRSVTARQLYAARGQKGESSIETGPPVHQLPVLPLGVERQLRRAAGARRPGVEAAVESELPRTGVQRGGVQEDPVRVQDDGSQRAHGLITLRPVIRIAVTFIQWVRGPPAQGREYATASSRPSSSASATPPASPTTITLQPSRVASSMWSTSKATSVAGGPREHRVTRGSEGDVPARHHVVDREYRRTVRREDSDPAHTVRGQQSSALAFGQLDQLGIPHGRSSAWRVLRHRAGEFRGRRPERVGKSQKGADHAALPRVPPGR